MNSEQGPSYRKNRKLSPLRILILFLAVVVSCIVITVGYMAYQQLQNNNFFSSGEVPIIRSNGELWSIPTNQGGKEIEFTNLPINQLVEGVGFEPERLNINQFSTPPSDLPPDTKSLNEKGLRLKDIQTSAQNETNEEKSAQKILDEFFSEFSSRSTESNSPNQTKGMQEGTQLNFGEISKGSIMAYLGFFPDSNLARNKWLELFQSSNEIVFDKDWTIFQFEEDTKLSFRLYALGFFDMNDAQEFCNQILARGYQFCTPLTLK